jgi:hypothetical protein
MKWVVETDTITAGGVPRRAYDQYASEVFYIVAQRESGPRDSVNCPRRLIGLGDTGAQARRNLQAALDFYDVHWELEYHKTPVAGAGSRS